MKKLSNLSKSGGLLHSLFLCSIEPCLICLTNIFECQILWPWLFESSQFHEKLVLTLKNATIITYCTTQFILWLIHVSAFHETWRFFSIIQAVFSCLALPGVSLGKTFLNINHGPFKIIWFYCNLMAFFWAPNGFILFLTLS